MSRLPPISEEPVVHVDCTPDADYPLRILRAHRQHCDCKWVTGTGEHDNLVNDMMNQHNDQRAKILDVAIALLEAGRDSLKAAEPQEATA